MAVVILNGGLEGVGVEGDQEQEGTGLFLWEWDWTVKIHSRVVTL